MPFDVPPMRRFIRYLVRDPNGDAVSDADLLSKFIQPAWDDWYARFERRTALLVNVSVSANVKETTVSSGIGQSQAVVAATYPSGTVALPMVPNDYNRVRYLQESEGATSATPRSFAVERYEGVAARLALYPIQTGALTVSVYGEDLTANTLTIDTDGCEADPVTQRYVARYAALRLGVVMRLARWRLDAIAQPLPQWAYAELEIDRMLSDPGYPTEQWPRARREPVRA